MRIDDFWIHEDEFWGRPEPQLNIELLTELRSRKPEQSDDVESALALLRIVYDDFLAYGTTGTTQMTDAGSRDALRTLRNLLTKIGHASFDLPFSDFSSFRSFWLSSDARGSWQARRDLLRPIFEPALKYAEELQDASLSRSNGSTLLPMPHDFRASWRKVDDELVALKKNFSIARTPQDYRNVGNDCVAVLIRIGEIVYSDEVHAAFGGAMPPRDSTKERIGRFVEQRLSGSANSSLRSLVRRVIELAQDTKHDLDGSRLRAILIADSVIMLANIVRSLDDRVEDV